MLSKISKIKLEQLTTYGSTKQQHTEKPWQSYLFSWHLSPHEVAKNTNTQSSVFHCQQRTKVSKSKHWGQAKAQLRGEGKFYFCVSFLGLPKETASSELLEFKQQLGEEVGRRTPSNRDMETEATASRAHNISGKGPRFY